jgi:ABC-type antimicrobial peptide transport system permease subunit
MHKAIAIVVIAVGVAACGMISTLVNGFKNAKAVEGDLEQVTGLKPQVGFNWHNGRLLSVTVTFPYLYDTKPVRELAEAVRAAVGKEFSQTPENIVLAFSLSGTAPGRTAQAGQTH